MLHAYYSVLRVVLSSLDLFALTFLSLPTLKQTCEPHTRSLLLTLWRTHTHTRTRIKTKWNWETCQHFRLCFYVCLSFLVISTHLNDNNNNISKVCGKRERDSRKWEIRYAIRFCSTVCIRLAMAKAYKHIHTQQTPEGWLFEPAILC